MKKEFYTEKVSNNDRKEMVKQLLKDFAERCFSLAECLSKDGMQLSQTDFELIRTAALTRIKELEFELNSAFLLGDYNHIQDIWIELEYLIHMER